MHGFYVVLSGLIMRCFLSPDLTALQVRKRAEWALLCGPLFVSPLLLFSDSIPMFVKIILEAGWVGSLFTGYVLHAEYKKRSR